MTVIRTGCGHELLHEAKIEKGYYTRNALVCDQMPNKRLYSVLYSTVPVQYGTAQAPLGTGLYHCHICH